MSSNIIRVIGWNDAKVEVFNELVGPFVSRQELNSWLVKNGFTVGKVIPVRKGGGYFHKKNISRSPLAAEVLADIDILCEPKIATVNLSPKTYVR